MFEQTPTPSARPIDRRRAATRDEIIAAAWSLCREHGLAQLSLRDLAQRVGMRAPSLYSYVSSKDEIYDLMFAQGQVEFAAALDQIPESAASRDEFRAGNHAFFQFAVADPVRYLLMFQRTLPGFVPSSQSYALAMANLDRLTAVLRAAGVAQERHVDLWTAIVTGLADQQLSNDPGGTRWQRLLDEAIDMFCEHVGMPAAPTSPDQPATRSIR